jgi:gliding motility-associated-like protein
MEENGTPCDSIETYWIDFGEGNGLQEWPREEWKKTQIANNYLSNGKYIVTLIVEANRGCRDTFRDTIIIPGPAPRFSAISPLMICENEAVTFVNESINPSTSARWIWNFDDGTYSSTNYVNSNGGKDTIVHTYKKGGAYLVTLTQYDSIPGTSKYCPGTYPDTTNLQIKIVVRPPDEITLLANEESDTLYVCVKDFVQFSILADRSVYDSFNIVLGNGSIINTTDTLATYQYLDSGTYVAYVIPHVDTSNGKFACPMVDTVIIIARDIKADFDMDSSKAPIFCFLNKSEGANDFRWGYYHEKDITLLGDELLVDDVTKSKEELCNDYSRRNGTWYICLEAVNSVGCKDTICKKITYHFIKELIPYNVFTPSKGSTEEGDGKNDNFVIPNIGVEEYKMVIVNRWGQTIFETEDNEKHWNGKVRNVGAICPDGTYYYTINYRFKYEEEQRAVHGVVTLIREK